MKHKGFNKNLCFVMVLIFLIFCIVALVVVPPIVQKMIYPKGYQELVEQYAQEYEIDSLMIYTVIKTESSFKEDATSSVDARGLMQITDITFDWIKSKIAPQENLVFEDLYKAENNIRFGTYFFSECMLRYNNDLKTAAAAYHSGWGTVDELLANEKYSSDGKILDVFPYEQMNLYTQKIEKNYNMYKKLYK